MESINLKNVFEIRYVKLAFDSVSIYRNLLEDEVIRNLRNLISYIDMGKINIGCAVNMYNDSFFKLVNSGYCSLQEYIMDKLIFNENPFSMKAENKELEKEEDVIKKAAKNDLRNLCCIAKLTSADVKESLLKYISDGKLKQIVERLPEWKTEVDFEGINSPGYVRDVKQKLYNSDNWDECVDDIQDFHNHYGCGIFARYRAFIWEHIEGKGCFKGIENPDPIDISDLIGYEREHQIVIENTLQFLNGFFANNVLLHGDRGTGKSSTVKAILNKYYTQGLRMIELPKSYLVDFPNIIRKLKNRPEKFIIFIDDLVFGDDEESYTALKSILEGGLENKSSNIIIYATSNRRHLVKEYFNERMTSSYSGSEGEVHEGDSVQEKLSLADRFGINVVFVSPDKNKYLQIVDGIAERRKLNIDKDTLHREALKWELWYNGRSARTARQFVDWIEGHNLIEKNNIK
ncbi:ATPase family associated with various cellular activities (AAA) [Clostridium ragsdalei P11]|uniref:ATPase family associated with various cellular activities (AAA) n=1 Tax=Clostridium ragsdalei P11 TaxID=1353534 RepID=A0A1A6AZL0_9CLOT|nr:ATP-binding protein [Clostridium ragsdalei]OBR95465.1 ATPase family associated with various cellular activities (AAA) [Clostridium ragsdalei P11]